MPNAIVANPETTALAKLSENMYDEASSASSNLPNSISIRNSRFWFVTNEGKVPLDNPLRMLFSVLLIKSPSARQYYEGEFDPGNASPPSCMSYDGVTPEPHSPFIQFRTCKGCPKSIWGSSASKLTGAPIPACREHKELVIKIVGVEGAWLFRIPPASIRRHWEPFVEQMKQMAKKDAAANGTTLITLMTCVTEASFDEKTTGVLNFKPKGYLSKEEQLNVYKLTGNQEELKCMVWGPDGSTREKQWLDFKGLSKGHKIESNSLPINPNPNDVAAQEKRRIHQQQLDQQMKEVMGESQEDKIEDIISSMGLDVR